MKRTKKAKLLKKSAKFSTGQLLIFGLIFAAVGGTVIWRSLAASPNGGAVAFSQTYENWSIPNTNSPKWCLSEDDSHDRKWSGSLTGIFTATEYFCTPFVDVYSGYDYWNGGGVGLTVKADVVGTLTKLELSNPGDKYTAPASQAAVLVGSTTSGKGRKATATNHYVACAYVGGQNFQGIGPWTGTWTATFSGSFSHADLQLVAQMYGFAGYYHYPAACPEGQLPPGSF